MVGIGRFDCPRASVQGTEILLAAQPEKKENKRCNLHSERHNLVYLSEQESPRHLYHCLILGSGHPVLDAGVEAKQMTCLGTSRVGRGVGS